MPRLDGQGYISHISRRCTSGTDISPPSHRPPGPTANPLHPRDASHTRPVRVVRRSGRSSPGPLQEGHRTRQHPLLGASSEAGPWSRSRAPPRSRWVVTSRPCPGMWRRRPRFGPACEAGTRGSGRGPSRRSGPASGAIGGTDAPNRRGPGRPTSPAGVARRPPCLLDRAREQAGDRAAPAAEHADPAPRPSPRSTSAGRVRPEPGPMTAVLMRLRPAAPEPKSARRHEPFPPHRTRRRVRPEPPCRAP